MEYEAKLTNFRTPTGHAFQHTPRIPKHRTHKAAIDLPSRQLPAPTVYSASLGSGKFEGIDYITLQVTAYASDTIVNSELIPAEVAGFNPGTWNGRAVVIDDGTPFHSTPESNEARAIGRIFYSYRNASGLLTLSAWLDPSKVSNLDLSTLSANLYANVVIDDTPGRTPAGEVYGAEWILLFPDYMSLKGLPLQSLSPASAASPASLSSPALTALKGGTQVKPVDAWSAALAKIHGTEPPKPHVYEASPPEVVPGYRPPQGPTIAANAADATAAAHGVSLPVPNAWQAEINRLEQVRTLADAVKKANR